MKITLTFCPNTVTQTRVIRSFAGPTVALGSAAANEIVFPPQEWPQVAPLHAIISYENENEVWLITPNEAFNQPVIINQTPLLYTGELCVGDVIQLGDDGPEIEVEAIAEESTGAWPVPRKLPPQTEITDNGNTSPDIMQPPPPLKAPPDNLSPTDSSASDAQAISASVILWQDFNTARVFFNPDAPPAETEIILPESGKIYPSPSDALAPTAPLYRDLWNSGAASMIEMRPRRASVSGAWRAAMSPTLNAPTENDVSRKAERQSRLDETELQPGAELAGRYRIIERLARGGFGSLLSGTQIACQ